MNEYNVEVLTSAGGIRGKLSLSPDKLVFEPDWLSHSETKEIPVAKIKDVRFATEKDISALRVWLVGPVFGTLWKETHRIILVDFEDKSGIIRHAIFKGGDNIEEAEQQLYTMMKERAKMRKARSKKSKAQNKRLR
jgi:hypothetical protein